MVMKDYYCKANEKTYQYITERGIISIYEDDLCIGCYDSFEDFESDMKDNN